MKAGVGKARSHSGKEEKKQTKGDTNLFRVMFRFPRLLVKYDEVNCSDGERVCEGPENNI